ncbi:hypothetical protein L596_010421 [Steinernema carpocapsae]|uniref:Sodium/solute symporter n=1 Tax=Steinernema carpocapsae TaxID=34508 RepID=A0A4U5PIU9_STECR|nr:hypothetical protein L596_010421 [Steinernema carpocapsae]
MNIWVATIGGLTTFLSFYGVNQISLQRFCSVPSLREAQKVMILAAPIYVGLQVMITYIGLLVLAYFYYCDPRETGEIRTNDQLAVLFAAKVAENIPGFPGLLLACIFAATLSTVSSAYNSLAAVIYNDYVKPRFGEKHALLVNKVIVFIAGVLSTCLAFSVQPLGGIVRSSVAILGATRGPVVGLFFLGVFVRSVSTRATIISFAVSIATCVFLWLCSVIENPYKDYHMPTNSSAVACQNRPFHQTHLPHSYDASYGPPETFYLSRISPFCYAFIGLVLVFFPAILLSYVFPPKEEGWSSGRRQSLTWLGRPVDKQTELERRVF